MKSNIQLGQDLQINFALIIGALAVSAGLLLGLLSAWVSPLWTFGVLIGTALIGMGLKRPELFVLAYLVITSSVFQESKAQSVSVGFGTIYFTDMIIFACFAMILVRWAVEPGFQIVRTPLDWSLFIFVGTSFISTIIAVVNGSVPFLASLGEIRVVAS
jgi:hypothetical protein